MMTLARYKNIVIGIIFFFNLLVLSPFTHSLNAEIAGPGWIMLDAAPVSIKENKRYQNSKKRKPFVSKFAKPSASLQKVTSGSQSLQMFAAGSQASITPPEIKELARGLQYDPKLIFDYVHNHIDYAPYYGALKGPMLTYLDGNGNDFDQAALMVALLRESGFVANFVYGTVIMDRNVLANQLGVSDQSLARSILMRGGIPNDPYEYDVTMPRVWIRLTVNSIEYDLDPAFKSYEYINKIDVAAAMGYNNADFMANAMAGATVGTDYVQNINENNISTKLVEYSTNFVNTIKTQYPNASVEEIIGGRKIIQTELDQYPSSLPYTIYTPDPITLWTEIPVDYTTTLRIVHEGIDYTFATPDLYGKRLTVTYATADGRPELKLGGVLMASGNPTTPGAEYPCSITIDHPYSGNLGDFADQWATHSLESGSTNAIFYGLGSTSYERLSKSHQNLAESVNAGMSNFSEEVLGERLNILGVNWILQWQMTDEMLSSLYDTVNIPHHRIGVATNNGSTRIDIPQVMTAYYPSSLNPDNSVTQYKATTLMGSAFEHNVIEQSDGTPLSASSTMKLLKLANMGGHKIFQFDSATFDSLALVNYNQADLNSIQAELDNAPGSVVILPENGQLGLGDWKGHGYIFKSLGTHSQMLGMRISGGYYGGYCDSGGCYYEPKYPRFCKNPLNWCEDNPPSLDPVDMATGVFFIDSSDLSVGVGGDLGLKFARSYNSSFNNTDTGMGYGWTFNNDVTIGRHTQANLSLGYRQPVDAAAIIVERFVTLDLIKNEDSLRSWVMASLTTNWSVNELINNAVTARVGKREITYVNLPDGSYSSPPGQASELIVNTDGTFSISERLGNTIDFDIVGRISQITDIDGNTVTFAYDMDGLRTITDPFGRQLTLTWTSGRITSVTDSTGRAVGYSYDLSGNLIEYTDPRGKIWKYGYDANHRITTLTNPLNIITATNSYDTLGRVAAQSVPRQGGYNVSYNLYFTGFRNIEEDLAGNQTIYYFDKKKRHIGLEDSLGRKTTKEYDGQNHVIREVDALSNVTDFFYDANHNLTNIINPLNQETVNAYDLENRLTDTINPLNKGTHFSYDAENHLTKTEFGVLYDPLNLTPLDSGLFSNSATFYPNGHVWTATDGQGTLSTYIYDIFGNTQETNIGSHPPLLTYSNSLGWPETVIDQEGAVYSYDLYNGLGLVETETDRLLQQTLIQYHDDGKIATITDRNLDTTELGYTPSGKKESITYQDGSVTNFLHDDLDNLSTMTDSLGTTTHTYYADKRLSSTTDPNGFTVGYEYDGAGNLSKLIYPDNKTVTYSYDALNRLQTVTNDWLGLTATYQYDLAGRLESLTNFNGTVTTYGYDAAGRLILKENRKSNAVAIATYEYKLLDGNGNPKKVIQYEPLDTALSLEVTNFSYNLEKNRLLTAGPSGFSYDSQGQQIGQDSTVFTFDKAHRLTQVSGLSITKFFYDGNSNRLKAERDGVVTKYVYDKAGRLVAEADVNNVITRYYIHGKGLMAMVTAVGQSFVYHYNPNGNTVAITDSTESIVNKYAYTPFGTIVNEVEAIPQPFKFVGEAGVMAESIGLYYMKARYYNPTLGRFISEDPLGFGGDGTNFYAYVMNNPIKFVDPSGLAVGDWWDVPANYRRAEQIALAVSRETVRRFPLNSLHNGTGDAWRHSEWSRRMTAEFGSAYAAAFGYGHEIAGIFRGQPLDELLMDLNNNRVGRTGQGDLMTYPGEKPY